jgi:hypothetical protein
MVVSKRKCVFQVVDDKKPKVVETIEPPPNKQQQILPRASDLTVQNRPQQTSTRLPSSAPVVVCLYKVTDRARDVWSVVEDTSAGLYQVQIKHDARSSVTFDILGSFGSYLQKANAENDDIPATLSDLSRNAFIKLVLTGDDPESVGFIRYRIAFYVAGYEESLKNLLLLLDGFYIYKHEQMAREHAFEVHVHPHIDIAITDEELEYKHYTFNSPAKSLPLKIFEAAPCVGKKILTFIVESISDHIVSILISGNTWQYRSALDDYGVPQGHNENGVYYRVMQSVDVSDNDEAQKILDLPRVVFANVVMRLVVSQEPGTQSSVATLVDGLRALSCLHAV